MVLVRNIDVYASWLGAPGSIGENMKLYIAASVGLAYEHR